MLWRSRDRHPRSARSPTGRTRPRPTIPASSPTTLISSSTRPARPRFCHADRLGVCRYRKIAPTKLGAGTLAHPSRQDEIHRRRCAAGHPIRQPIPASRELGRTPAPVPPRPVSRLAIAGCQNDPAPGWVGSSCVRPPASFRAVSRALSSLPANYHADCGCSG